MPIVLNKRTATAAQLANAVYVGRPTKWGNPFSHMNGTLARFRVSSRSEAIDAYRSWILAQPDLCEAARRELRGKDLVCWCAPLDCHAAILIEIANG